MRAAYSSSQAATAPGHVNHPSPLALPVTAALTTTTTSLVSAQPTTSVASPISLALADVTATGTATVSAISHPADDQYAFMLAPVNTPTNRQILSGLTCQCDHVIWFSPPPRLLPSRPLFLPSAIRLIVVRIETSMARDPHSNSDWRVAPHVSYCCMSFM